MMATWPAFLGRIGEGLGRFYVGLFAEASPLNKDSSVLAMPISKHWKVRKEPNADPSVANQLKAKPAVMTLQMTAVFIAGLAMNRNHVRP